MKTFITKTIVLSASFLFLSAMSATATEVQLWGSTTCQKRFLEPGAAALEKATGVKIKVFGVGTGKGMIALFEGKTTVALASETMEDAVASAQKTLKEDGKPEATVPADIQFHEITRDVIVPIVNKDNPVESLTWAQLTDLNTGKATNWKDVGGPDLPVVVITSHAGSATKSVFQKMVMKKAEYAASAIEVKSTRLEIGEVTKNKGGIGAVSEGFFNLNKDGAKIVKTDKIDRPLGLITIGAPSPEVQKIIDYFKSPEGQKQIVD